MPRRPSLSANVDGGTGAAVTTGDPGRLDDQLCFALYAASNAMQRTYTPLLRSFGLTYVQYLVLLVLWETDDRSVGEIGARLFLDSGTLTPVLRRLEHSGYVDRRRSTEDERTVRIRLTARGVVLEGEMDGLRATISTKASLDSASLVRLRQELRALHRRLTAPAALGPTPTLGRTKSNLRHLDGR